MISLTTILSLGSALQYTYALPPNSFTATELLPAGTSAVPPASKPPVISAHSTLPYVTSNDELVRRQEPQNENPRNLLDVIVPTCPNGQSRLVHGKWKCVLDKRGANACVDMDIVKFSPGICDTTVAGKTLLRVGFYADFDELTLYSDTKCTKKVKALKAPSARSKPRVGDQCYDLRKYGTVVSAKNTSPQNGYDAQNGWK
ncbi:MAG: hypothetical protein Q9191_001900 [Dirinaria sp. TL-2023a]